MSNSTRPIHYFRGDDLEAMACIPSHSRAEEAARELLRRLHKSRLERGANHPMTANLITRLQNVQAAIAGSEGDVQPDVSVTREAESAPITEARTIVVNGREITVAPKPPKVKAPKVSAEARDKEAGDMYLAVISGLSTRKVAEQFGKSSPNVVANAIARFAKRHDLPRAQDVVEVEG